MLKSCEFPQVILLPFLVDLYLSFFLDSANYFLKNKLISILDVRKKTNNFHARHSAKLRTYEYLIANRQGSLSINKNRAWHVKKKININLLKKGAKLLEGTHNFSTFRAASCSAKSPIKTINVVKIRKLNDIIKIRFSLNLSSKSSKIHGRLFKHSQ